MKALKILQEQYNILNNDTDGIWIDPKKIDEAIKELEDLQNRSCENCYESKTCKILHSVYKDRLKKEGYAMPHKNEFKCGFWHSLFQKLKR